MLYLQVGLVLRLPVCAGQGCSIMAPARLDRHRALTGPIL